MLLLEFSAVPDNGSPTPLLSERNADGAPCTPERREGHTPGHATGLAGCAYHGSPGFGVGVSAAQHETIGSARQTPNMENQQHNMPQTRSSLTPMAGFLVK